MAFRTGYGVGLYSADAFGIDSKLVLGAASGSAAGAATTTAVRIVDVSASGSAVGSGAAAGYTAYAGAASAAGTSSVALYWNRVRPFAAADTSQSDNVIDARYKWLDTSVASVTWVDADYREGAA
jgi:hypothetical protein